MKKLSWSTKAPRRAIALGLLLGPVLLAGCAGQPSGGGSDFDQVNLAPGKTAFCYSDPCAVMFAIPPGKGSYTVRANNQVLGTYPAGQVANLGNFFRENSPFTFTIDGLDAKPAIFYVQGNF
jgi:hypothetical protein